MNLEELRKRVKEKEARDKDIQEQKKLESQLEEGTLKGLFKKVVKDILK